MVTFSPDSQRALAASTDGTVQVWDLRVPDPSVGPLVLHGYVRRVIAVAFSPDGQQVLAASDDGTVQVWDLTGKPLATLQPHTGRIDSAVFSPDGSRILTVSFGGIARVWDLRASDPNSRPRILSSSEGDGNVRGAAVAFSPDGQRVLAVGRDGNVLVWDLRAPDSSISPSLLHGHEGAVTAVTFSPDGQRVLTGSDDGTARVWDLRVPDPSVSPLILGGPKWQISMVAFSPDGKQALAAGGDSAGTDGSVRVWDLGFNELAEQACRMAGRNLTWDEWQQFFSGYPYHTTCPKLPPHPSFIAHLVAQGADLAKQGKIADALAAYQNVQQRYPVFEIDADSWNTLCRQGSLWGQAAAVLDICERLVTQAPNNGAYRDSRGLARALTGNSTGAIEDFNAVIKQTESEEQIAERKAWIAALQAGRNPFDADTLKALRGE